MVQTDEGKEALLHCTFVGEVYGLTNICKEALLHDTGVGEVHGLTIDSIVAQPLLQELQMVLIFVVGRVTEVIYITDLAPVYFSFM